MKGAVVGEGDSYEEALAAVRSAIQFHLETFGQNPWMRTSLSSRPSSRSAFRNLMSKFPVDAPLIRVIRTLEALSFRVVRRGTTSPWCGQIRMDEDAADHAEPSHDQSLDVTPRFSRRLESRATTSSTLDKN